HRGSVRVAVLRAPVLLQRCGDRAAGGVGRSLTFGAGAARGRTRPPGGRPPMTSVPDVAILIPCFNEAATIRAVVTEFLQVLPRAKVYVFDNNSTDGTAREASAAGATVVRSPLQGKGQVVRHMFEHVRARHSIMVDGDGTYPAAAAGKLLDMAMSAGADMVVGVRLGQADVKAFRKYHTFGNHLISGL